MNYGATLTGVQAYITNWTIGVDTHPTILDVEAWLVEQAAEIDLIVGPTSNIPATQLGPLETFGRDLVHRAVASRTIDAAIPERAYESDQSYGQILWARYKDGLKQFAAAVADAQAAGQPAGIYGSAASANFPEPARLTCRPL